jgi:deltex
MNLGFPGCYEAIQINYRLHSGVKEGVPFSGTSRTAFLPNNKDGQEVLTLMAESFRRKLTFVVGTSVTTGQSNVVVWGGIHHKTSPSGGFANYGYPDETYFDRVKDEMA